jgi:hypothetical protein
MPGELILLGYIDRFGAQAVLGRPLSAREIRGMVLAENVVNAYREREASSNFAIWMDENEGKAILLNEAMLLWQMQA